MLRSYLTEKNDDVLIVIQNLKIIFILKNGRRIEKNGKKT